jgi:hypothetical protein
VAREVRDVGGVARPCLTASAAAPLEAAVAVAFPSVRVGRTLHGHSGPAGSAPGPAPVRIAVLLDGEEVGAAELPGATWTPFHVDMTRSAGQVRTLSLVLTSPGPIALCLDALVLP